MKLKHIALPLIGIVGLAFSLVFVAHRPAQAADRPTTDVQLLRAFSGTPVYLGRIDATGSSETNHQASTPFNNTGNGLEGKILLTESSATCDVGPVTTNTGTITAATGVQVIAGAPGHKVFGMALGYKWLAVVGTCDVDVWELL